MKRRADRARRDLADLVFRLCTAGGLMLGLLAAVSAGPGKPKPREPGTGAVGPGFLEAIAPMLPPMLGGLVVGLLVGFVLAMAIKPRR